MNKKKRNPSQKRAIAHLSGPMLALAGPGSGKTSVIVDRIQYLIETCGVSPSSVLVVTFSRAAAAEMKERFLKETGRSSTPVTFGTFHGVFYGILRQAYGLTSANILGEDRKYGILRGLAEREAPQLLEEGEFLEELSGEIAKVKGGRIALDHYYSSCCPDGVFRKLYAGYQEECKGKRLIDFEDMLLLCWELLTKRQDILSAWQRRFSYFLVDEFQDINKIQYDVVKLLALPENNLFVVGDDDQSIYFFRGARPEIMLNFEKDFPGCERVLLDVNYRCSPEILRAALRLIGHNQKRFPKELRAHQGSRKPVRILPCPDPWEQGRRILEEVSAAKKAGEDLSETAVLFRTHGEGEVLVRLFMEYQIPFRMKDKLPDLYDHWLGKNLRAYLRLAAGERGRGDFLLVMNRPNRYLSREAVYEPRVSFETLRMFYEGKDWMCDRLDDFEYHLKVMGSLPPFAAIVFLRKTVGFDDYVREYAAYRKIDPEELFGILDRLQESAKGAGSYPEWEEQIREYQETLKEQKSGGQEQEGVVIATLHSVKGLEYRRVYICNVNEGTIPYKKASLPEQVEEERRLLYVGMTRAKEELTLSYVTSQYEKPKDPSRFLEEIQDE